MGWQDMVMQAPGKALTGREAAGKMAAAGIKDREASARIVKAANVDALQDFGRGHAEPSSALYTNELAADRQRGTA